MAVPALRAFKWGEDEFHQGSVFQHLGKPFSAPVGAVVGRGRCPDRTVPVQVQVGPGTQVSQYHRGDKGSGRNRPAMGRVPNVDVAIDDSRVVAVIRRGLDSSLFQGRCRWRSRKRGWCAFRVGRLACRSRRHGCLCARTDGQRQKAGGQQDSYPNAPTRRHNLHATGRCSSESTRTP